ncbi:hypothetical protein [Armatimonas sp.]|uniref:hypothetical protein n=1 Tax=Armatimonas sp. TaxID=1872638 RepID=UPI0037517671
MINRRELISLGVISTFYPEIAQPPSQTRHLKDWQDEDPRLLQKCTIDLLYSRLWYVFDEIYRQTGILINSSDSAYLAGEEISFFAFDVPVIKILDSIYSLFSFRTAECFWLRQKKENNFIYSLERSSASVLYAKNVYYYIRGEMLNALEEKIANCDKSEEERKKIAEKSTENGGFDKEMDFLKIKAFGKLTTPELRKALLFSDEYAKKEFPDQSKIPEECYQYYNYLKPIYEKLSPQRQWGSLDKVSIYNNPKESNALPIIYIMLEGKPDGGAGYGVTGATKTLESLKSKMRIDWVLDSDSLSSKEENIDISYKNIKTLPIPIEYYDSLKKINQNQSFSAISFETIWHTIAKEYNIPVLMRLPKGYSPSSIRFPNSAKLKDFTGIIDESAQLLYKWHDESLLICPIAWYKIDQPEKKPTGSAIKILANARRNNKDRKMNLVDLFKIINTSPNSVLERMILNDLLVCNGLGYWKSLFLAMDKNLTLRKAILSSNGVTFESLDKQTQGRIQNETQQKINPNAYVRFRKEIETKRQPEPRRGIGGFEFTYLIIECRSDLSTPFVKVAQMIMDFQALPLA